MSNKIKSIVLNGVEKELYDVDAARQTDVGALTDLSTAEKGNIVAAINAVQGRSDMALAVEDWFPTVTVGQSIKQSDGTTYSATNRARTSAGGILGYGKRYAFSVSDDYECCLYLYDSSTTYLGYKTWASGLIVIPANAARIGVAFRKVIDGTMTSSDKTAIENSWQSYMLTDTTLSEEYKAADAKVVGDAFSTRDTSLANYKTGVSLNHDYLFEDDKRYLWTGNLINFVESVSESYRWFSLKTFSVEDLDSAFDIVVSIDSMTTDYSTGTGVQVFYQTSDSSWHGIGNVVNNTTKKRSFTVPASAVNVAIGAVFNYGNGKSIVGATTTIKGIFCYNNPNEASFLASRIKIDPANVVPNLPNYYYANSYIQGKRDAVRALATDSAIGDCFVFVTDCHWGRNAKWSPALAHYMLRLTSARFIIFGGDVYDSYSTPASARGGLRTFVNAFAGTQDKLFCVIGNHDFNDPNGTASGNRLKATEVYSLLCKGRESEFSDLHIETANDNATCCYCVDNVTQKIRYFFLGCNRLGTIPSAVNTWFASALAAVPDGWNVLVISHATFDPNNSYAIHRTLDSIVSALEAAKTRLNVIGIIGGHVHTDKWAVSAGGVLVVSTTQDAIPANSVARTAGTITEQALDVVSIDLTNKRLYMTRIGYGNDRVFEFGDAVGLVT